MSRIVTRNLGLATLLATLAAGAAVAQTAPAPGAPPAVQVPPPAATQVQVPPVRIAGKVSATVAPDALLGPALLAVMV